MNYLIPTFDCVVLGDDLVRLKSNVKYKIQDISVGYILVFANNNQTSFILDLNFPNKKVLKLKFGGDNYYFLFADKQNEFFTTNIVFKSMNIVVSLFNKLLITCDGELICEQIVENLNYSHFDIVGDVCFIYFKGDRNFVVVIKDKEVQFANYYDECNATEKEKFFMCKLKDSLNHGLVCHIKENVVERYLVYLDDEELNLKQEFLPLVFLDCLKAGNFKYCNDLLNDGLKLKEEKQIKNFFPEFDFYYPLTKDKFMLANKNTLAGIYAFEIENNKINNITNL